MDRLQRTSDAPRPPGDAPAPPLDGLQRRTDRLQPPEGTPERRADGSKPRTGRSSRRINRSQPRTAFASLRALPRSREPKARRHRSKVRCSAQPCAAARGVLGATGRWIPSTRRWGGATVPRLEATFGQSRPSHSSLAGTKGPDRAPERAGPRTSDFEAKAQSPGRPTRGSWSPIGGSPRPTRGPTPPTRRSSPPTAATPDAHSLSPRASEPSQAHRIVRVAPCLGSRVPCLPRSLARALARNARARSDPPPTWSSAVPSSRWSSGAH